MIRLFRISYASWTVTCSSLGLRSGTSGTKRTFTGQSIPCACIWSSRKMRDTFVHKFANLVIKLTCCPSPDPVYRDGDAWYCLRCLCKLKQHYLSKLKLCIVFVSYPSSIRSVNSITEGVPTPDSLLRETRLLLTNHSVLHL